MNDIDWDKQHCGVHQCTISMLLQLMPSLRPIIETFPDKLENFTWDVKVHMLMPRQYPCIPHWHYDFVPRVNGIQCFDMVKPHLPMYFWISGAPLTQFHHGYITPKRWMRFSQLDAHRGTAAADFGWRGLIRAVHKEILPPKDGDWLRRHTQVYVDENTFEW